MRTWENDWPLLINKRAAIKEQFPKYRDVIKERPGTVEERAQREYWHAENRSAATEAAKRARTQEADANRFIAMMRAREQERFLARINAKHPRRTA